MSCRLTLFYWVHLIVWREIFHWYAVDAVVLVVWISLARFKSFFFIEAAFARICWSTCTQAFLSTIVLTFCISIKIRHWHIIDGESPFAIMGKLFTRLKHDFLNVCVELQSGRKLCCEGKSGDNISLHFQIINCYCSNQLTLFYLQFERSIRKLWHPAFSETSKVILII